MISTLKEQLAIDTNCSKEDFDKIKNSVTILCHNHLKRRNISDDLLLFMACFGKGTVAAVDKELEPFMTKYTENMDGFRCFDMPLNTLENELKKHGGIISEIEEFYLLNENKICPVTPAFDAEILEGAAIEKLYGDNRFHMALEYSQESDRRDMLAVAAYENGEILGVAAASNDTDDIWQIGVDVVPEKRQYHVATDIVRIISNEILKRNKIPYYGTAWSNIASKRVAVNAGFKPVWVEMKAMRNSI
ncbi:MAG: GNAT family N-acetyltransferase [Oscillospiraceae bacterium]|nr:GNAT family N-acetyltransferase [Oscillospiraceae bacterium]